MSSDKPTRASPARDARSGATGGHLDEQTLADLGAGTLTELRHRQALAHIETCERCRHAAVLAAPRDPDVTREHIEVPLEKTSQTDPLIGARLSDFVVTSAIARGGMGVVYAAEQAAIGKRVAIKVLLPHAAADPNLVSRLLAEARVLAALQHPNIVDVNSFGTTPTGQHYLVMEFLEGEPLSAVLHRERQLAPRAALEIMDSVLAALDAAHRAGVLHRDLKPGNIFLTPLPDGTVHVKLLDFGVAKSMTGPALTAPDLILGTPGYMAPEQIGGAPLNERSDLYALGVLAWVMMTGEPLFPAESAIDVLSRHMREDPPHLSDKVETLPDGLDALVTSLLARRAEERPASAAEARREVQRIRRRAELAVTLPNHDVLTPLSRLVKKGPRALPADTAPARPEVPTTTPNAALQPQARASHRWLVAVVAFGLLAGAAAVFGLYHGVPTPQPQPPPEATPEPPRARVSDDAGVAPAELDAGVAPAVVDAGAPAPHLDAGTTPPNVPRPATAKVTRAELERRLKSARGAIGRLDATNRNMALTELGELEKRLAAGEAPGEVAKDLTQLLKDYGAR